MILAATPEPPTRKPFWRQAYVHVILAAIAGAGLGALNPVLGTQMKPLADGFIALIQLAIAPLIFLVVATGVAQVGDMRKVGRIGLKAIIYFEAVTTIALIGLRSSGAALSVHFSNGVAEATPAQAASVAQYSKAHAASLAEFSTRSSPTICSAPSCMRTSCRCSSSPCWLVPPSCGWAMRGRKFAARWTPRPRSFSAW